MWLVLPHLLRCFRKGLIETERESLSAFLLFCSSEFLPVSLWKLPASVRVFPVLWNVSGVSCRLLGLCNGHSWCGYLLLDAGIPDSPGMKLQGDGKVSMKADCRPASRAFCAVSETSRCFSSSWTPSGDALRLCRESRLAVSANA